MPVSATRLVERIARVLAGCALSSNADGDDPSAAESVDSAWRGYEKDARAIVHTLREPDGTMAEAGDVAVWERMVEAALGAEGGDH